MTDVPQPAPGHGRRLSIRLRLTLWYGGALFLAGVAQLITLYILLSSKAFARPELPDGFELPPGIQSPDPADFELRPELLQIIDDVRAGFLRDLLAQSAIALLVVGGIAILLGWWLAGRALAPIHAIATTAERVSEGSLDQRIQMDGPNDELKELADAFDAMLGRLERSFESQQRFVANASHELRTPLTIEKTILEVELANPEASDDLVRVGNQLLEVQDRSQRLIDGLLALARGDQDRNRQSVDLTDLVESVVAMLARASQTAQITLNTETQPAQFQGDSILIDRLVLNLVQNAIDYNQPGGWVQIRTSTRRLADPTDPDPGRPSEVVLEVENTGPVIDPDVVPGLFEPFRRGQDRTGTGVGLGLSIARMVVEAHAGKIQAEARSDGGLKIVATLPVLREF